MVILINVLNPRLILFKSLAADLIGSLGNPDRVLLETKKEMSTVIVVSLSLEINLNTFLFPIEIRRHLGYENLNLKIVGPLHVYQ